MVEKAHKEHKERLIETSPIVIKIGGSTLQKQNTAVEDISSLRIILRRNPAVGVQYGSDTDDKNYSCLGTL